MTKPYQEHVFLKFQLYNSLFLNLPFEEINNTGTYLPLLSKACEHGFEIGLSPTEIVEKFTNEYFGDLDQKKKTDVLFHFIQYIERQVVLFDSVEDAAFSQVNNLTGSGTITELFERSRLKGTLPLLKEKLKDFVLRIVLTAHPTQFYPGTILGIITDLGVAIQNNEFDQVNDYLKQLGKTPFLKKTKPTPYDEAISLIWYLENVFYESISDVVFKIEDELHKEGDSLLEEDIIQMGFWPGGDRDGNPFVNAEITKKVAGRLKRTIQILYFRDIRVLKRRLTFPNVYSKINAIEKKLYNGINQQNDSYLTAEELLKDLREIDDVLLRDHQGIFSKDLRRMITKVKIFALSFARIDIRQDSSEIEALYRTIIDAWTSDTRKEWESLDDFGKIDFLENMEPTLLDVQPDDLIQKDTLETFPLMQEIQATNGLKSCHRYIISNTQTYLHVFKVFHLARLLRNDMMVDVVPLFETIDDLHQASTEMEVLYSNALYRSHLESRGDTQTIMLGFSDGTKDGGYLSANWAIFQAKEALTSMSRKYGIKVAFFDGRGGPPARGGGNTHKFYASLGDKIEDKQVQITVQGQTISSNFGTPQAATYNIEQLLSAGLDNFVFSGSSKNLTSEEREILEELGRLSNDAYVKFKNHPKFLPYLDDMGTLPYYGATNIGSRPVKRSGGGKLTLKKLRAIPFVGSWSQMKQNVPGYYGFGIALEQFRKEGKLDKVKDLYNHSLFFQTLVQNSMQSLCKCYFPLTAYLSEHEEYGEIWNVIHDEYNRTKELLLYLSGESFLLQNSPDTKRSIELREDLVLPLLTIQQYALSKTRSSKNEHEELVFNKMVLRTMFGIINAGRNSA